MTANTHTEIRYEYSYTDNEITLYVRKEIPFQVQVEASSADSHVQLYSMESETKRTHDSISLS